jgi:hypothetical protein
MRATYTGGASAWDKEVKHCNLYLYIVAVYPTVFNRYLLKHLK